jgi:cytochrome c6
VKRTLAIGALLLAATAMGLAQSGGEATYKTQCLICHGATGNGDTPAGKAFKAKSVHDPEVIKTSDVALLGIIKNGSGKMPAFKDKLTDAQIKDVLAYVRELEKK